MADERGAFLDDIAQTRQVDSLTSACPDVKVKDVNGVWNQWDAIKQTENGLANEREWPLTESHAIYRP